MLRKLKTRLNSEGGTTEESQHRWELFVIAQN